MFQRESGNCCCHGNSLKIFHFYSFWMPFSQNPFKEFDKILRICLSQASVLAIRFLGGSAKSCCHGNIFMIFQSYSLLQPKSLAQFTMTFLRYVLTKTIYSSLGFWEDLATAFAMATVSKFSSLKFLRWIQPKPLHGF